MHYYYRIMLENAVITVALYFVVLYGLRFFSKYGPFWKAVITITLMLLLQAAIFIIPVLLFNPINGLFS